MTDTMKKLNVLLWVVCLLLAASALAGLTSHNEGFILSITSADGRLVELFGRGAYANQTVIRATSQMGADLFVLIVIVPILLSGLLQTKVLPQNNLVRGGTLLCSFYYSISLAFGVPINRFFLLYTALFSVTGLALGIVIIRLSQVGWKWRSHQPKSIRRIATLLFLLGVSALVWLSMILPVVFYGDYSALKEIHMPEPTFVLDIGVISPLFIGCGIGLFKQKKLACWLAPVLLTFYVQVGGLVIIQTFVQRFHGIRISLPDMIGLVASFVFLGILALVANIHIQKELETNSR